ncbi:MAG: CoA transferase [Chloroflexota bacterium]
MDQEPVPHAEGPSYPAKFPADALPNIYKCKGGRYMFFGLPGERWEGFCRTIGLNELAENPEYRDPIKQNQHAKELSKILAAQLATRPAAEWEKALKAGGGGNVVNVVRKLTEVYDDPQVIANEMITTYEQPGFHPVTAVTAPLKLSASAGENRFRRPAPTLGEHTFEVLPELGYTGDEIAEMAAEQVLR